MKSWIERNSTYLLISGLVGLYILSVLINLGHLNLDIEEPRRVIVSLEMLQSGDYFNPHTLGWVYYNKPPLFNWIIAGFIRISGSDSEFVCRLPTLISILLLGYFQYFFSKNFLGKRLALLSGFFVITCADMYFYWASFGAEIDIFYSLIVYLQVIFIFWFYEKKNFWKLFIYSWFFCALGFFTKGFPSLIFQTLTLGALCIYARSLKILFKPQHLAGIAIFLFVSFSFLYIYSFSESPKVLIINLLNESLLKSGAWKESAGIFKKIFSYPELMLRVFAPWCLILLFLLKKHKFGLLQNPIVRFSLLFILVNIGVYWIASSQKTRYIIMFIPFVMSIVAFVIGKTEEAFPAKLKSTLKYTGFIFPVIILGLLVLPFYKEVNWGIVIFFAVILLLFTIQYFRLEQYRLWLFITGIILVRLVYTSIYIPLKKGEEFDTQKMANYLAEKNNFKEIRYWGQPLNLNLDVVFIDTLYKWKDEPVKALPESIRYQVPFYIYKATGTLVKYDTIMQPGQTYISYSQFLKNKEIDHLAAYYDEWYKDSLILFRPKNSE